MKVMFVSSSDPKNVRSWSGTTKSIFNSVENFAEEVVTFHSRPLFVNRISRVLSFISGKKADFYKTKIYSKHLARRIHKIIRAEKPDIIIGVAATVELANVKTGVPVIHISDATYMNLYQYHPNHLKIWNWSKRSANKLEQQVIDNADVVVLPTAWASQSALEEYKCPAEKLKTIPLGANLREGVKALGKAEVGLDKPCKLLFVGVDWQFKGGDIAYKTLQSLRSKGVDASLQIIGCEPPADISSSHMSVKRFLDKHDPAQYLELVEHFSNATFFIMPTRAEAFGIVFAEAAMFGLPAISYLTGGVGSVIDHGETGFLLPVGASGHDFADIIMEVIADDAKYQAISKNARAKYESQLNWGVWQKSMEKIINRCLSASN